MTNLAQIGRRRTLQISASILIINLVTIYIYHSSVPGVHTTKTITQIVRLLLTIGLLYSIYLGKKWAKILRLILFGIAAISAYIFILTSHLTIIKEVPFYVMIFIYSDAVFHFGFSKSFKAFEQYQNKIRS